MLTKAARQLAGQHAAACCRRRRRLVLQVTPLHLLLPLEHELLRRWSEIAGVGGWSARGGGVHECSALAVLAARRCRAERSNGSVLNDQPGGLPEAVQDLA